VAIASHEKIIFISLDENRLYISRKKYPIHIAQLEMKTYGQELTHYHINLHMKTTKACFLLELF
jgi:hypothetical protein